MKLEWWTFFAQKGGNAPEEYEDAFAGDESKGMFAVADGATESSFANYWAQQLVKRFVAKPWPSKSSGDFADWLGPCRDEWSNQVDRLDLPWYAETKRDEGAFATLLGVVLRPKTRRRPGRWFAVAVGDSCLFRVRRNTLLRPFPLTCPAEFGNRPNLVGSRLIAPNTTPKKAAGIWQDGDLFYLMTDALAQWFLLQHEQGKEPWNSIEQFVNATNSAEFPTWTEDLRRHENLRNDDTTLVRVALFDGDTNHGMADQSGL